VIGVFFMHKDSVALAKVYNTVFLLDCTYKTNKFNMPLLNIVGIACTYATFNAGFAFLREETEEHYTWALKQLAAVVHPKVLCTDRELALMKSIASVFPTSHNLLCVWHINKNLASRCKKYFTRGEQWDTFLAAWNRLVYSRTEVTFAKEFAVFQQTYSATNPTVMEYVNSTWMPHTDKFVACYINEYLHFGSSSTSRVEGNHHIIKSYIRLGSMDLLVLLTRLTAMLANQTTELNAEIRRQQIIVSHHLKQDAFRHLHSKVSLFALGRLHEQLKHVLDGQHTGDCSGKFTKTWGLPCKHMLRIHLERGTCLSLHDIHPQWHLDTNPIGTQQYEANAPDEPLVTPRKRLLMDIEKQLYSDNPRRASLMARLPQVADAPGVQIRATVVVNPRGRPAGKTTKKGRA